MLKFGSLSDTPSLFDSGLSSILTNSTNNSITSGSPPNAFTSSYIDRPDTLFSSLYEADSNNSGSNQFSLASSINNTSSSASSSPNTPKSLSSFLDLHSFGNSTTSDISTTLNQLNNHFNSSGQSNQNQQMERPTSFNTGGGASLFSTDYSNTLGAPGQPIGVSQMSLGNLPSPFGSTQHTPVATPTSGNSSGPPKNPKLYKTELCRSWMDHGKCNYGERCQYAHGEEEKRPVPRHPKYKTEACQSFHQSGYCPYGPRCHFIHKSFSEAPNASSTPFSSPVSTPITVNGQPSLYASQYHNMTMKASTNGVPSNVLQRVYSLPGGYGSAGESPAGSSNDSGSESPNGSFSPGLDLDETGPFSAGFLSSSPQKIAGQNQNLTIGQQNIPQQQQVKPVQRHNPTRFLSYDQSNFNDNQFSHLLNDICQWNLEDSLSPFSASTQKWSTDDYSSSSPSNNSSSTPSRLPVFAQLSNPQ